MPDDDETEVVRWVALAEIPGMIARGEIVGAATIIGVQYALVIADEVDGQAKHRADLSSYREVGTIGYGTAS